MAYQAMISDTKNSKDANIGEGAMILHLVIQNLGDSLTDEMWKGIFTATINKLN